MNKEIQLHSRGGIDNKLVQIEGEPLKFKLEAAYGYRVGFKTDDEDDCTFIDPAGGPFITVGTNIEGYIVKTIFKDGTIEFEEWVKSIL